MGNLSSTYVQSVVEERLLAAAKLRSGLSANVFSAYDFRQLQTNLLSYVGAVKALLITIPRDVLGDSFNLLYRRVSGLEPLILRATDTTQLLKYSDTADEVLVDIINALFKAGIITEPSASSLVGR
ncbi:MAG: hypothetical protein RXR09_01990 [Acidilobus sp.]|jgi:hypothetical protein